MSQVFFEMDSYVMVENHLGPTDLVQYSLNNVNASQVFMYEKTLSQRKMTNGNDMTHNTKHTILFNKTKFTPYSVPPAHAPASV